MGLWVDHREHTSFQCDMPLLFYIEIQILSTLKEESISKTLHKVRGKNLFSPLHYTRSVKVPKNSTEEPKETYTLELGREGSIRSKESTCTYPLLRKIIKTELVNWSISG